MSARVQDSLAVLIQQQQEILTALQELARIIEETPSNVCRTSCARAEKHNRILPRLSGKKANAPGA
jgi:hypothetical protein